MRLDGDLLAQMAAEHGLAPASLGVVPLDLAASLIGLDPERLIYPASMIKVPLVAAVLALIGAGQLDSIEAPVEVTPANMTANDAESPLVPGYRSTPRELMDLAISRSDNVATNVLFDIAGRERATEVARTKLGLQATVFARKLSGSDPLIEDPDWDGHTRNAHPVADAVHLFRLIADDAVTGAAFMRDALAAQVWNNKLSLGLREGDRFFHKTGDTSEVTHDGGILLTAEGKRYVVVAYTELESNDENNARFGPFMREVRELL